MVEHARGTLNVCLVGYGGIAAYHARALQQIPGVRLHSIVGRRREPAEVFARQWGFARCEERLEAALADGAVEAVVITSPSQLHCEMTRAALEAGRHVLVEIPLAMSARGGRELAELAAATGLRVQVAHSRRFEPTGHLVHELLVSGRAGRIYQHQSYSFWLRHENVGWTGYRRSWVDDVLFHHGCHLVDFALWCTGQPVRRVRGELSPLDARTGTSLDVSLLVRFADDAIATISLSYSARQAASGCRFICENGVLDVGGGAVRLGDEVLYQGVGDLLHQGVLHQDQDFVEAIRSGRQTACPASEAVPSLEVLQEVYDQMVVLDGEDAYRRPSGL